MKKILPFITVIVIVLISIFFLNNKDSKVEEETTDIFDKYKDECALECSNIEDFTNLIEKIEKFSKDKELNILKKGKSYIQIGSDNQENTCIYLNLDFTKDINKEIDYIPLCLYIVKENPKINLLITESKGLNFIGLKEIKDLKIKKLIDVKYGEENKCYTKGAYEFKINLEKELTREEHKYDLNYNLNISNVSFNGDNISNIKKHPIYILGNLFTYFKNHDILYQLNNMKGNSKKYTGNQELNISFSIPKNSKEAFENQLEEIREDFEDNSDIKEGFIFEANNIENTEPGFTTNDSDSIFNLFYILKDGIVKINEDEEIQTKTEIDSFHIKENTIYFNITQQGKTLEDITESKNTLDETAKLLGLKIETTHNYESWKGTSDNIANYLNDEDFDVIKSGKMDLGYLNYLNKKFPNLDIISLQFEDETEYSFFSYILNNF